jgi:hypothetical protein
MSAGSPSPKFANAIFALAFCSTNGLASDGAIDPLKDYRTRLDIHGLFEIRAEARKFIAKENLKNGTKWEAMDPDLRVQVTKCAVPLKAKWVPKSYGLPTPSLEVICSRTINPKIEKKWRVFVPIFQGPINQK